MSYELQPELRHEKLLDVVHYVASQCAPSELGKVKLHKILYYTDMLQYLSTGESVTGGSYQKQQFGPVARHLTWAIDELCRRGRLKVESRDYYGYRKLDLISQSSVDACQQFSNAELSLLNDVIEFVTARSAKEVSEISHNEAWSAVEMGEEIPYFSAFGLVPSEITDEDLAWAEDEINRIESQMGAEERDGGVH